MLKGFVSAVRTLSLLPIPGRDAEKLTDSLPWFPVVGAFLSAMLYGLWRLLDVVGLGNWTEGVALILVAAAAVLTRGLHLDGLADAADGFFSMTTRARTLEIMKDSRIGTFGVLALMTILGFKWAALNRLVEQGSVIWVVPAFVVSRVAMVELAASLPYARAEGGTGFPFVETAGARHKVIGWMVAAVLASAVSPLASAALLLGYVTTKILGRVYLRRLGGITGDLLGATCELVETLLLFVAASQAMRLKTFIGWEQLPW
jgi:adenosylcobinamide-GDP ribazoletransferase